jgi:cytochrome c-type biogenesis protein CcmH/NrfG
VSTHPESAAALNNLAHVLAELGCYSMALDAVREALTWSHDNPEIHGAAAQTEAEIMRAVESSQRNEKLCALHGE